MKLSKSMQLSKRLTLAFVLITTSDHEAIRTKLKAAGVLSREDEEVARVKAVLRGWVLQQAEPFTTDAAMDSIGIAKHHRSHSIKAQVGLALQELGCKRVLRRISYTAHREVTFQPPVLTERLRYASKHGWEAQ